MRRRRTMEASIANKLKQLSGHSSAGRRRNWPCPHSAWLCRPIRKLNGGRLFWLERTPSSTGDAKTLERAKKCTAERFNFI
jgi:hypothetical protein